jgi:hypothetical protein
MESSMLVLYLRREAESPGTPISTRNNLINRNIICLILFQSIQIIETTKGLSQLDCIPKNGH